MTTLGRGESPFPLQKGEMIMTKAAIRRELNNVKCELEWLAWCEKSRNPEWRFTSIPYSKRRVRLVRSWWALKAMQ